MNAGHQTRDHGSKAVWRGVQSIQAQPFFAIVIDPEVIDVIQKSTIDSVCIKPKTTTENLTPPIGGAVNFGYREQPKTAKTVNFG